MKERLIRPYVELHRKLDELAGAITHLREDNERIRAILQHVTDEEPANRRRLYALRETEDYERAFTEDEPLVTFIIPTYKNFAALRDRSLPSVLSQSYPHLDVLVIGDGAPPETEEVVSGFGDPRLRYYNRTYRGPYPEDPQVRWRVIGNAPHNEAVAMARGRWIAQVSDDDAIRPHHTETLLKHAQEHRLELCYGRLLVHFDDGEDLELGEFPPRESQWSLQQSIYHAGLDFIGLELSDALYDEPSDWSFCRRMLQIGVRTGIVEEVVVDKHETRRNSAEWSSGTVPGAE